MACKSLIIGIKPRDMFDELFPFENAMIEINEDNISEVVDYFLNNEDKYKDIVERNYEYVINNHRWRNRYNQIIETITK